MSASRNTPGEPPRVTFVAVGRTFERLLKETSLAELSASIRKKLALDNASQLVLAQVRGERRIDLEDEDDFDAFRAYAQSSGIAEVSIASANRSQAQPTIEAEQDNRVVATQEAKPARKKKSKKPKALSADSAMNANSDVHASPAPPLPAQVQADAVTERVNLIQPIQSTAPVAAERVTEPPQNSELDGQDKKGRRKRKRSLALVEEASGVPDADVDASVDPAPAAKKRKAVAKEARNLVTPDTAEFTEATGSSSNTAVEGRHDVPPAVVNSSEMQDTTTPAIEHAETTVPPKQKKLQKKKEKAASTVPAAPTATVADPRTDKEVQGGAVLPDVLPGANAAAPDAPSPIATDGTGEVAGATKSVTRRKRKDPKGLEQADAIAATKNAVIPRKRRKAGAVAVPISKDEPADTVTGESVEDDRSQPGEKTDNDQSKLSFHRSLAAQISRPRKKTQLPKMNDEQKKSALDDVLDTIMRRHRTTSLGSGSTMEKTSTSNKDKAEGPTDQPAPQIALKETTNGPRKQRTKKDKQVDEAPQAEASLPSTSAVQLDRATDGNNQDPIHQTAEIDERTVELGRPSATTSKAGVRRTSTKKAALETPSKADPATKKPRENSSVANDNKGGTHGPARGSGDQIAGPNKVINPIAKPSPISALPFAPSGSSVAEVEIQGNDESSSSDSETDSEPDTETDRESNDHDEPMLAKQPESMLVQTSDPKANQESDESQLLTGHPSTPNSPRLKSHETGKVVPTEEPLGDQPADETSQSVRDYDDDTTAVQSRDQDRSSPEEDLEHNVEGSEDPEDANLLDKSDMNVDLYAAMAGLEALNAPAESVITDGLADAALAEAMEMDDTSFFLKLGDNDNEAEDHTLDAMNRQIRELSPPSNGLNKMTRTSLSVQRMKDRHGKAGSTVPKTPSSTSPKSANNTAQFPPEPSRRVTRRIASAARAAEEARLETTPSKALRVVVEIPTTIRKDENSGAKAVARKKRAAQTVIQKNAPPRSTRAKAKVRACEAVQFPTEVANNVEEPKAAGSTSSDTDSEDEKDITQETTPRPSGNLERVPDDDSQQTSRLMTRHTAAKQQAMSQTNFKALSQPVTRMSMSVPRLSQLVTEQDLFSPQAKSQPPFSSYIQATPPSNTPSNIAQDDDSSSSSSSDSDDGANNIPKEKRAGSKTPKQRKPLAYIT